MQLRRIIKEELKHAASYDRLKEGFLDSFNAGFSSGSGAGGGKAKAGGDIDLDSLNYSKNKFSTEQREFLENLLSMNSKQLASQYSDTSKEMNNSRSKVPSGTPDEEIVTMIFNMAYPELDL